MKIYRLMIVLLLIAPLTILAQEEQDTLSRWDYHIDLGTGVSVGLGNATCYTAIHPSIEYRPTEKWTLRAGFLAFNTMDPNHFYLQGTQPRSLAPRRNSSTAVAASLSAQYQVNDHLWLAASVFHLGGQTILPGGIGWYGLVAGGQTLDLDITGVTAHARYRFNNGNTLGIHLSVVGDRTGALVPFLCEPYYGYPCGYGFASPFDSAFLCSPFDY